jgi:hypothetical protein
MAGQDYLSPALQSPPLFKIERAVDYLLGDGWFELNASKQGDPSLDKDIMACPTTFDNVYKQPHSGEIMRDDDGQAHGIRTQRGSQCGIQVFFL